MLKAIGDKIIVKVDTDETVTKSGIILQGKQERPKRFGPEGRGRTRKISVLFEEHFH